MNYECIITVLETKVFPELQEKYLADPKSLERLHISVSDNRRNCYRHSTSGGGV